MLLLPHKSACTTMKRAVIDALGLQPDPETAHDRLPAPLAYVGAADIQAGYRIVGVIRDPYRRAISSWQFMRGRQSGLCDTPETFLALLDVPDLTIDVHIRDQYADVPDDKLPTAWLYVEHLDDDWQALCRRVGWPPTPLLRLNETGGDFALDDEALRPFRDRILARYARSVWLYDGMKSRRCAVMSDATWEG